MELNRRVDAYFAASGLNRRDDPRMYLKTAIILTWAIASYVLLVFWASGPLTGIPLALSLTLAVAGIGFCIQHDGGHRGYSNRAWINKLAALGIDALGGCSYVWHYKHNIQHHCYTNIVGVDGDINFGFVCRMARQHRRRWIHRFQHLYMWLLYGSVAFTWHWYIDIYAMVMGRIEGQRFPRPRGAALATVIAGKAFFVSMVLVIPLMFHAWWVVLLYYAFSTFILGATIAIVFVLAHCVAEATFVDPGDIPSEWAAHQIETTVDFGRNNKLLSWYLGGLNFQTEHHLYPNICHVHYPAMSLIVEEVSREFGVRYQAHDTMFSAIRSHYRNLRDMGRSDPSPVLETL